MPELQAFYQKHGSKIPVLGITYDPESDIRDIVRERKLTYPILRDEEGGIFAQYNVRGIPQTVIVDSDGHIVDQLTGVVTRTQLEKATAKLLP